MQLIQFDSSQAADVIDLFGSVFSDSEGQDEGRMIADLVASLISSTDAADLEGFISLSDSRVEGAIFFSRLWFPDNRTGFILSPVAVATRQQGKGVGQQLIRHGLMQLEKKGVDLVFTYGDPAFYGKLGFQPISESVVKAPLNLSYPHGWLAQSLAGLPILPAQGAVRCVEALNDQKYW